LALDVTVLLLPFCGVFMGFVVGYVFGGFLVKDMVPGKDIWLKKGTVPVFNIQSDGSGAITDANALKKRSITEKIFGKK
jgi:hypothetical protein